ncbi:hypothetical protein [Hydrogenimonas sp.]
MGGERQNGRRGIDEALVAARNNDIDGARKALGISETFSDEEVIDALISVEKGLELFSNQRFTDALGYLKRALPVIEASHNEGERFFLSIITQLAEGMSALFNGDAHQAARLLNISSDAIERISFFNPDFKIASLNYKAVGLMASARAYLNAGDITAAERIFGEVRSVNDELLKLFDPEEKRDNPMLAEVYGIRLELDLLYIIMMDIPALDLDMWKKRLEITKNDVAFIEKNLDKIPENSLKEILKLYMILYDALEKLHHSLEVAIVRRRPFEKDEIDDLVRVDTKLFKAKRQAQKYGEMGRGMVTSIDLLRRLQRNILPLARVTQDDGRKRVSGLISFAAFVVLIVVMHFTAQPTGYTGVLYYSGALVLSLITGFGYGALKFQPMLNNITDAMKRSPEKG